MKTAELVGKALQLPYAACSYNFKNMSMCSYNFNVAVRISINQGAIENFIDMPKKQIMIFDLGICYFKTLDIY